MRSFTAINDRSKYDIVGNRGILDVNSLSVSSSVNEIKKNSSLVYPNALWQCLPVVLKHYITAFYICEFPIKNNVSCYDSATFWFKSGCCILYIYYMKTASYTCITYFSYKEIAVKCMHQHACFCLYGGCVVTLLCWVKIQFWSYVHSMTWGFFLYGSHQVSYQRMF